MLVTDGKKLRALIEFHLKKTKQSQRGFGISLGLHPDYITGYLRRSPDDWGIPKLEPLQKICAAMDIEALSAEIAEKAA